MGDVLSEPLQRVRQANRRQAVHALALLEGAVAKRTVKLAAEPPGERRGIVHPSEGIARGAGQPPIVFSAVGDSTVAGCGVGDQSLAVVPRLAQRIADHTGRDVAWNTEAQLGATMRRVRHRFLPLIGPCDILMVCAGSNDVMAGRGLADWREDFGAVLDRARELSPRVVACSAGPLMQTPSLGRALRHDLGTRVRLQSEASMAMCRERGVVFADVASGDLVDGYWADDAFHPGETGYQSAADTILSAMLAGFDPAPTTADDQREEAL